jgi:hypothetical protein
MRLADSLKNFRTAIQVLNQVEAKDKTAINPLNSPNP